MTETFSLVVQILGLNSVVAVVVDEYRSPVLSCMYVYYVCMYIVYHVRLCLHDTTDSCLLSFSLLCSDFDHVLLYGSCVTWGRGR